MHRPGTELAISWSLVRRPNTTLTEQPVNKVVYWHPWGVVRFKFSAECGTEIIFKIGYYLMNIWTRICCVSFFDWRCRPRSYLTLSNVGALVVLSARIGLCSLFINLEIAQRPYICRSIGYLISHRDCTSSPLYMEPFTANRSSYQH